MSSKHLEGILARRLEDVLKIQAYNIVEKKIKLSKKYLPIAKSSLLLIILDQLIIKSDLARPAVT